MNEVLRPIFLSGGARLVSLPISAACNLTITGVIIARAGAEGFAAVSVVATIFMLLQFSDLGVGSAVINAVAESGERSTTAIGTIASAARVLIVVGAVLITMGVFGTYFFSWGSLLGIGASNLGSFDVVTASAIALFALSLPFGLGSRVLTAVGRNQVAVAVNATVSVFALLFVLALMHLSVPVKYMALSQSFGILVSNLLASCLVRNATTFAIADVFRFRTARAKGVLRTGVWMLLVSLTSAVLFQLGRVILARLSNASEVAAFSLGMQFFLPALSVVSAAGFALWPVFARRRGHEGLSKGTFLRLLFSFSGFGLVLAVLFFSFVPMVGKVVSQGLVVIDARLAGAFGLLLAIQSVQVVPGMFLTDHRGLRMQSLFGVMAAILATSTSVFLAPGFGAQAVVLSTAAGVFFGQLLPCLSVAMRRCSQSEAPV